MGFAMRGLQQVRPEKRRFVLKRKFVRYYALCALFGVRKQVFVTFALWVLVTVYDQPVETIALLWVVTLIANLVTQPGIGWLIDRFGPRRILTIDALCLVVVCLLYGYSEHCCRKKELRSLRSVWSTFAIMCSFSSAPPGQCTRVPLQKIRKSLRPRCPSA